VLRSGAERAAIAVSVLVVAGFAAAATSAFSQRQWIDAAAPRTYQLPEAAWKQTPDPRVPVYQMSDVRGVRLVGRGVIHPGGNLVIEIYPDLQATRSTADAAIWMPGNLRSIRALMPSNLTLEFRTLARRFADGLEENLRRLADTPRFQAIYRPELEAMISRAIETSWNAPSTRASLAEASAAAGQQITTEFFDAAMPVLLEYQQNAFAKIVDLGRRDFFARLLNWREALAPLKDALDDTMRDDRVQAALAAELEAILSVPETAAFAREFGLGVVRVLAEDPRWPDMVERIIQDPALEPEIAAIEDLAAATGKQMFLHLIGQEEGRQANVMALNVMRDVLLNRGNAFILLLPESRRDILTRVDGEQSFRLRAVGEP
jgi:hypothetical protein